MKELIIDLQYKENEEKPDIFQYYFDTYSNNYTQYFTTQISSLDYADNWPYGTGDVFLNPSRNIADYPIATAWSSKNIANSWMMIRFHHISLKLKHYTISQHSINDHNLFQAWKVECSMNGKTWIKVDQQEINEQDFIYPDLVKQSGSFTFETQETKIAKYIKITQTGKSASGSYLFIIGDLKLYGEVYKSPEIDFTCKYKRTPISYSMIIIIVSFAKH